MICITLCPSYLLSTLSNYFLTLWCKWGCSPPTCPDMLANLFRHRTCNCSHQLSVSFSLCLSIIWNVSYYRQAFRYGSRNAVPIISSLSWDRTLCWGPTVCIVTVWNEQQMQSKIKTSLLGYLMAFHEWFKKVRADWRLKTIEKQSIYILSCFSDVNKRDRMMSEIQLVTTTQISIEELLELMISYPQMHNQTSTPNQV